MGLIEDARTRENRATSERRRIDYDRMNKVWPKQKAALTRAKNTGDPEKVAKVVKDAVAVWDEIGAWPDDWSLFERTLNDALPWNQQVDIRYL
jgi:hypothetical protein